MVSNIFNPTWTSRKKINQTWYLNYFNFSKITAKHETIRMKFFFFDNLVIQNIFIIICSIEIDSQKGFLVELRIITKFLQLWTEESCGIALLAKFHNNFPSSLKICFGFILHTNILMFLLLQAFLQLPLEYHEKT